MIPFGVPQGNIKLPDIVLEKAKESACLHFFGKKAINFDGDKIETLLPSSLCISDEMPWFPEKEIFNGRFEKNKSENFPTLEIVITAGCDMHTDHICGPTFLLCLYNDGLIFRQLGKKNYVLSPGDWLVFDDYKMHGVKESKGTTAFVGCVIPLAFRLK